MMALHQSGQQHTYEGGWTCLIQASNDGDKQLLTTLLRHHKADIDKKTDVYRKTALHKACERGYVEIVKILIQSGASINQKDKDGQTALHSACYNGRFELAEALIHGGASIDLKDVYGLTALHYASYNGHLEIASLLLEFVASVDQKDKYGQTALHLACANNHAEVVRVLIRRAHRATIDQKDQHGQTALHLACHNGHFELTKTLLHGGASIDQKDNWGKTPLDRARNGGHSDVVKLLEAGHSSVPMGHILTKFELQVLSALLDAYSNKVIKEIQQFIQKKQGGGISREEVERSLREAGLATVADELEQNLHKGVERAEHYAAYKAALEGAKTLTLRYLRFLFIGVPRSGKSTMRQRLLKEIINLSNLGQPSVSTGAAETYDVLVKKMTNETAAISNSRWWSLKKRSSDVSKPDSNDEGDLYYLIHLYYQLICNRTNYTRKVEPIEEMDTSTLQETSTVTETKTTTSDTGKWQETTDIADKAVPEKSALGDSDEKAINAAFEKLTTILQSDSPEELHHQLEALTLINMADVGGQPEFLDMLPALTIGAAFYFLFIRLDRDLHEHYPVTFLAPGDSGEMTLETSYCMNEVIHQALASIACFGRYSTTTGESASSCAAALFGTYSDKVTPDKIAEKEEAITKQFFSSELCSKLLQRTNQGRPFFTVDNMNGTDESEMSKIRDNIEKIVKALFEEVPIPASWLMFRIVLHLLNKPVVTLRQCEEIARRLSMPTTVQEALWFFHHDIGSLLYYPDIPSMRDLIICTPQVISDSVTTVIIDNFKHDNYYLSNAIKMQFQQSGLFRLSDISRKTERHIGTHLAPKQLVDVLKHNSILAEVKCDDEEAAFNEPIEPKFIIPAVLKLASDEELKPSSSLEASPLMIRFEGGFVPFGVFSASIARLIAHANLLLPQWSLYGKEVKKNKVKFLVAGAFVATLISRPQYLEIQVEKHPRARYKHTLAQICFTVQQTVVQTLETTISKMKYRPRDSIASQYLSSQRPFFLAYTCCLADPNPHCDHLMKVSEDENGLYGKCLCDGAESNLEREHLVWFNKQDKCLSLSKASITSESNVSTSSDMLDISDLHQVLTHTMEARAKWYHCGLALGLSAGTLDAFEKQYKCDCTDCYTSVLKTWLRGSDPQPCKSALCNALRSQSVGRGDLADKLNNIRS